MEDRRSFNIGGIVCMKNINISYASFELILKIIENRLLKKRNILKEMVSDKNISAAIYDNAVDECKKIEYAILELKKEIKNELY